MPKYIIRWDYGFGDNYDEIEADSVDGADAIAYDIWREDIEHQADYEVIENKEATDKMREEYLQ